VGGGVGATPTPTPKCVRVLGKKPPVENRTSRVSVTTSREKKK